MNALTKFTRNSQTNSSKHTSDFFERAIPSALNPDQWKKYRKNRKRVVAAPYQPTEEPTHRKAGERARLEAGLSNAPYQHAVATSNQKILDALRILDPVKPPLEPSFNVLVECKPSSVRLRVESLRARYVRQYHGVAPQHGERPKRGKITEFSEKSRSRLASAAHDLQALGEEARMMVTLTYPGDWQTVAPDGVTCKKHFKALEMRLRRYFKGVEWHALWFLEFQVRGAPHFHLILWGDDLKAQDITALREKVASSWSDIVDHPNPTEREKHVKAGTSVEWMRSKHFGYASKYATKMQQKLIPDEFTSVGRFWGFWNYSPPKPITSKVKKTWKELQALYKQLVDTYEGANLPRFFVDNFKIASLLEDTPPAYGFNGTIFGQSAVNAVLGFL